MTIWRTRIACWIIEATNTHSSYVIRTDVPVQQLVHGNSSMLRYRHIAPTLHFEENMERIGTYDLLLPSRKCVIPVVCVKLGKGMQSNTT